jgi:hypothetical protein
MVTRAKGPETIGLAPASAGAGRRSPLDLTVEQEQINFGTHASSNLHCTAALARPASDRTSGVQTLQEARSCPRFVGRARAAAERAAVPPDSKSVPAHTRAFTGAYAAPFPNRLQWLAGTPVPPRRCWRRSCWRPSPPPVSGPPQPVRRPPRGARMHARAPRSPARWARGAPTDAPRRAGRRRRRPRPHAAPLPPSSLPLAAPRRPPQPCRRTSFCSPSTQASPRGEARRARPGAEGPRRDEGAPTAAPPRPPRAPPRGPAAPPGRCIAATDRRDRPPLPISPPNPAPPHPTHPPRPHRHVRAAPGQRARAHPRLRAARHLQERRPAGRRAVGRRAQQLRPQRGVRAPRCRAPRRYLHRGGGARGGRGAVFGERGAWASFAAPPRRTARARARAWVLTCGDAPPRAPPG